MSMYNPGGSKVPPGFRRLAEAVWGQEHVGVGGGLLHRLFRFLGGDPSAPINVTSTGTADVHGLGDNTPASSATVHVVGNPIAYTVDGTVPTVASSPQLPAGAVITLTGQPSLKSFQFISAVAASASVVGAFYD